MRAAALVLNPPPLSRHARLTVIVLTSSHQPCQRKLGVESSGVIALSSPVVLKFMAKETRGPGSRKARSFEYRDGSGASAMSPEQDGFRHAALGGRGMDRQAPQAWRLYR